MNFIPQGQGLLLSSGQFQLLLIIMVVIAIIVFIALFFIDAGYGKMISKKWGPAINNKLAWVLMECPVFLVMFFFWYKCPERRYELPYLLFFVYFQLHYFQRSFIFPLLLKGHSRMPIVIMLMGMVFNTINGYMQGEWIYFLSPQAYYGPAWVTSWQFLAGTALFIGGLYCNLLSDHIIRNLRKPGDTKHYLPNKGPYKYVTSANYFGEIIEWIGFALLTWSLSGVVFAFWTIANLVPRANSIYHRYQNEFPDEFDSSKLKRVFPFIY